MLPTLCHISGYCLWAFISDWMWWKEGELSLNLLKIKIFVSPRRTTAAPRLPVPPCQVEVWVLCADHSLSSTGLMRWLLRIFWDWCLLFYNVCLSLPGIPRCLSACPTLRSESITRSFPVAIPQPRIWLWCCFLHWPWSLCLCFVSWIYWDPKSFPCSHFYPTECAKEAHWNHLPGCRVFFLNHN